MSSTLFLEKNKDNKYENMIKYGIVCGQDRLKINWETGWNIKSTSGPV